MDVSIVIPTRDRAETLGRTLDALAAQAPPPGGFEIVVVDNGSTDATAETLRSAQERLTVPLTALHEPRPGPAAARNTGIRRATGRVILFLGDDMAPADDRLVVRHAGFHAGQPTSTGGLLGQVVWDPGQPVTPFMRWLDHGGPQFRFYQLEPGLVDAAQYFYTANLSVPAELLARAGGFDERFPYAALEDMDLGLRLRAAGFELHYDPAAVVLHDHPTTLEGSLRRMERVGESAQLFWSLHPDAPLQRLPRPTGALWWAIDATAPLARLLGHERVPGLLRHRAWLALHARAYAGGFRRGAPSSARSPGAGAAS